MGSLARSRDELLAEGGPWKFVFFWGHTPRADGQLGSECFSQWWPAEFSLEGQTYATAEHYMMAEKARLFDDHATLDAILRCDHPAKAKKLGRTVVGFDQEVWERERWDVVVRGNLAKFSSHPKLLEFLLGTGQRVLVEASPHDRVWGIGLTASDAGAADPEQWDGENLLGFALMEVRHRLGS